MKLTVLGGAGAWPTAEQACSGYLVEHAGFRLLVDPGYASFPVLQRYLSVERLDAVLVSHGHPDHCADLNPLLRARALHHTALPALPVYAPPGSLDAVLALDRPGMLADAVAVRELTVSGRLVVGPFQVASVELPHFVTNYGLRLTTDDGTIGYTGDTGPSARVAELAGGADIFVCEATYPAAVPAADAAHLTSAKQAGEYAAAAGVGQLVLTHLWPGTDPAVASRHAATRFDGPVTVATPGLTCTPAR